jgi:(p)ppGpp synthase/HD superfamily hydrolase
MSLMTVPLHSLPVPDQATPQHACARRIEASVIAALLHDVVDDTRATLGEVRAKFGARIARIVRQVGQLSTTTQLLRRRRRTQVHLTTPS